MSQPPDRAPIAVICAVAEELAHLRAALPPAARSGTAIAPPGSPTWTVEPIVLALCGIGMLGAAAATEATIGPIIARPPC